MPGILPMIVTADLERLRAFYVDVLGATEGERTPPEGDTFYLELTLGGSELGLVADAQVAPGPAGRILLSIDVPDVDALLPAVTAAGGTVPGPANDMPWGQRVAHVSDPDGNALNLTQTLSPAP